ncbi:type VI secretion system contractile sheath large subunit [Thalassotalea euphylliae]|nr:type VI secretion system contractile sheath large subunit [Thalassotalea euphylliae]
MSSLTIEAQASERFALIAQVKYLMAQIDQKVSAQLTEIITHPAFEQLESRWRSLHELIHLPVNYQAVKVKILNISWSEISQDLNISSSVKQSKIYNLVANKEFNTLGGEPYGLIAVDHQFSLELNYDNEFDDLYTLELLAELGERSLCPFVLDVDENFFGAKGEMYLSDLERVSRVLASSDFDGWHRLRTLSNTQFIGLVFNKVAIRERYRQLSANFIFNEIHNETHLWGNAAMTFIKNVMLEFNRVRWFGFLKSRKVNSLGGSTIGTFALSSLRPLDRPYFRTRLSAETATYLAQQGFISVFYNPLNEKYFFQSNNSVRKESSSENRFLLQTTLMICRIAHYLKVQLRTMIGTMMEPHDCENQLNHWLEQYCSNSIVTDESTLATMPLQSATVKVVEEDASERRYSCQIELVPQYQYDRVTSMVSLSTSTD